MVVNQNVPHSFNSAQSFIVLLYHNSSLMDVFGGFQFFTLHAYLSGYVQVFPKRKFAE